MRLPSKIKVAILNEIQKSFGDTDVYLFGSRVEDSKRGGDIDIAVKSDESRSSFRKKKSKFLSGLTRAGYNFRIDLVQYNNSIDSLLNREIQDDGIKISDS